MFRVVYFDIDGTLIRTHGAGVKAFAKTFADGFALPGATRQTAFSGRTDRGLVIDILLDNELEPSEDNIKKFFRHYLKVLSEFLPADHHSPLPGVCEWLQSLSALPNPPILALLTGNHPQGAQKKLTHFNLWDCFAFGVYGDLHADRDQLARVALRLAQQKVSDSLSGNNLLVIGDTPRDIQCARAIGARVLAVATGNFTLEDLQSHQPDWIAENLNEISPHDIWNCTPK